MYALARLMNVVVYNKKNSYKSLHQSRKCEMCGNHLSSNTYAESCDSVEVKSTVYDIYNKCQIKFEWKSFSLP